MDKALRNVLRSTVTQARGLLEGEIGDLLEGQFGIHRDGRVEPAAAVAHLSVADQTYRTQILASVHHIEAAGYKTAAAVEQLTREATFTHLNRLCAYKLLERRKLIRESVSRGTKSNGFLFYLADHPDDEALWNGGQQDAAYRQFLQWLGGTLSEEIGVLFAHHDPANRLFPRGRVLDSVLGLLNSDELAPVWDSDETIGWVYQYFTPKELRDRVRKESAAPRNSYELAFRNQFFTPRYVVEFLTDNTLGRLWYEMRGGRTRLAESCRYLVRRHDPVFLRKTYGEEELLATRWLQGDNVPEPSPTVLAHTVNDYNRHPHGGPETGPGPWLDGMRGDVQAGRAAERTSQDLLDYLFWLARGARHGGDGGVEDSNPHEVAAILPILRARRPQPETASPTTDHGPRSTLHPIAYREREDPRRLRVLDPACGSGHFLLYAYDLLETIYDEAWDDEKLGRPLQRDYPDRNRYRQEIPRLILAENLHGIDIDLRATQIAALALWLRAQRSWAAQGVKREARPRITRTNIVPAAPMPGERDLLAEFVAGMQPPLLGQLVQVAFAKMKLAGEVGSLLMIEREIREALAAAKKQWLQQPKTEQLAFWAEEKRTRPEQLSLFDVSGISDDEFWEQAEALVLQALSDYATAITDERGYMRTLFADDARQGFGFLDLCHKRYAVVLMNPPFGAASLPAKAYIETAYPRSKQDLYAAFVERGLDWLRHGGQLGAITSRSGFFLTSFQKWREDILLTQSRPTVVADLGQGVLDTAMVETAAYCLEVQR